MKTSKPEQAASSSRRMRWLDIIVALSVLLLVGYGVWRTISSRDTNTGQCKEPGITETVHLNQDKFSQPSMHLNRCDRLRIVNTDASLTYEIAFGAHDKHIDYPGYNVQQLHFNEYLEIDASQAGHFELHDHLRDKALMYLDISE